LICLNLILFLKCSSACLRGTHVCKDNSEFCLGNGFTISHPDCFNPFRSVKSSPSLSSMIRATYARERMSVCVCVCERDRECVCVFIHYECVGCNGHLLTDVLLSSDEVCFFRLFLVRPRRPIHLLADTHRGSLEETQINYGTLKLKSLAD